MLAAPAAVPNTFGQSQNDPDIRFTDVKYTKEGSVMLSFTTETNGIYQIDFADSLTELSEDGHVLWQPLITGLASQGTNTLFGDNGNYEVVPNVVHPKNMPMRFYRVSKIRQDSGEVPTVSVTSLADG